MPLLDRISMQVYFDLCNPLITVKGTAIPEEFFDSSIDKFRILDQFVSLIGVPE